MRDLMVFSLYFKVELQCLSFFFNYPMNCFFFSVHLNSKKHQKRKAKLKKTLEKPNLQESANAS